MLTLNITITGSSEKGHYNDDGDDQDNAEQ